MLCINRLRRVRSFSPLMRDDRLTLSLNRTNTKYLPGKLTSAVSRGPLVLMGSFAT